jgi:hypothetical protein
MLIHALLLAIDICTVDAQRAITGNLKFATTAARTAEAARLTALSGSLFGGYFAVYQGVKYGARIYRDEDDVFNVLIAGAITTAPMVPFPVVRARFPYAVLLVAIDTLNNHVL